ncbi:unnamed protein product [Arabidopsis halleri]
MFKEKITCLIKHFKDAEVTGMEDAADMMWMSWLNLSFVKPI